MTSQTKKTSKKTKAPTNESELGEEFYQPQRAKSTRTAKNPKSQDDQELVPAFCKNSIPFIDRHIFLQNSSEAKEAKGFKESLTEIPIETLQITQSEENSNQLPPPAAEETVQLTQEIPGTPDNTPTVLGLLEDQYHPDSYLFREQETKEILGFISKCIRENSYHSLLISGQPGVGKTVVMKNLLRRLRENGVEELSQIDRDSESEQNTPTEINVVNVNASYSETLSPIVLEIIKAVNGTLPLSVGDYQNNAKTLIDKLKQILLVNRNSKDKKLTVVFLDEIDTLLSKPHLAKELAELVKVPKYPSSNLIIIMATNIADLVAKLLDLHKIYIEAEQMTFEPYSLQARKAIIKNRLASDVIDPLDLNLYEQLSLDKCIDKMNLLKDTDPRQILRIIRRALNKKKEAVVKPPAEGEDSMQIEPQNLLPQLNKEDILTTYEESYDEHLSKTFSSLCQKHLLTLAAILSILAKKGGDTVVKKDVMSAYNTMCPRLFLPKIDLVNLSEMLSLFEVYKVLELKPKEVDASTTPVKENIAKNTAKNANDEFRVIVAPEKIRNTLNQDGFFVSV